MGGSGGHAVVLGASIGGLFAARVLADAYERVTIVERDLLPQSPQNRRGVPQGRQTHALLAGGALFVDELFPGLLDEVVADGAPILNRDSDPDEVHFALWGHHLVLRDEPREPLALRLASRPLFEWHVRERLRGNPSVSILDGHDVVRLLAGVAAERVTGVVVEPRSGAAGATRIDADLVVDATGRGSRTPTWLEQLGYERPPESKVTINLRAAGLPLRLPAGALKEKFFLVGPRPGRPMGFLFFQHEDRWILTVNRVDGRQLPPDLDGLISVLDDFAPPQVTAALRRAEPVGRVSSYHFPSTRWRRYDKMRRLPDGLIVLGDAMCSLNPVYGQGESVAAMAAVALRDCLRRRQRLLPRRYYRAAAKRIKVAWQLASGSDLGLPEAVGPRPLRVRLLNAYLRRYLTVAERDGVLAEQFLRVASFIDHPSSVARPAMLRRVLAGRRERPRLAIDSPAPETAEQNAAV